MAFVVEDGSGKPDATSYCPVAVADEYYADLPAGTNNFVTGPDGATWAALANADKQRRLIMATRQLDAIIQWSGLRRDGHPDTISAKRQRLEWPRYDMFGREALYEIESNTIPEALQHATAEFAGYFGDAARVEDDAAEDAGMSSLRAGDVNFDFDPRHKPIPNSVYYLLYPNWIASVRQRSRRSIRSVKLAG